MIMEMAAARRIGWRAMMAMMASCKEMVDLESAASIIVRTQIRSNSEAKPSQLRSKRVLVSTETVANLGGLPKMAQIRKS